MDFWKFFHRILLLACVGLVVAIVARLYWPLMERQRVLRDREAELRLKGSSNTTECVPVPTSEHVAEIVGRQGKRAAASVC